MNDALSQFNRNKEREFVQKKEAMAERTLEYYNRISYMIACDEYQEQESFLYSVLQFIEDREYISERQIEAIDRIFNEGLDRELLDVPF